MVTAEPSALEHRATPRQSAATLQLPSRKTATSCGPASGGTWSVAWAGMSTTPGSSGEWSAGERPAYSPVVGW